MNLRKKKRSNQTTFTKLLIKWIVDIWIRQCWTISLHFPLQLNKFNTFFSLHFLLLNAWRHCRYLLHMEMSHVNTLPNNTIHFRENVQIEIVCLHSLLKSSNFFFTWKLAIFVQFFVHAFVEAQLNVYNFKLLLILFGKLSGAKIL